MSEQAQSQQQEDQNPAPSAQPDPAAGGNNAPAVERPAYVPEAFWDGEKGAVKADDFAKKLEELTALEAQHAERAAKVPEAADKYEFKLPDSVKLPEGVELNPDDPRVPAVRELAHKIGLSQEQFSELVAVELHRVQAEQKAMQAFIAAESAKLGPKVAETIETLKGWITANADTPEQAQQVMVAMRSAEQAKFFLKVMKAASSQGVAPLTTANSASDPNVVPGWEKMSFAQKRAFIDERAGRTYVG